MGMRERGKEGKGFFGNGGKGVKGRRGNGRMEKMWERENGGSGKG
jgi:hypothetical protein